MPSAGIKRRIEYIDIAKGIGILAVMIGHVAVRLHTAGVGVELIFRICFTFHMPLFFLLSGYFLHVDRTFDWKKESKRLVVPYIACAVVVVVLQFAVAVLANYLGSNFDLLAFTSEWASAALYGAGALTGIELVPQTAAIGAIWFLLALFWARMLVTYACRLGRGAPLVIVLVFAIGYYSSRFFWLPLSIQSGMCASLFVWIGAWLKKHENLRAVLNHPLAVALSFILWGYAIWKFSGFGMATNGYGDTWVDFCRNIYGSLAGSWCVIWLSKQVESHQVGLAHAMAKLGRYSLLILCVHLVDDDVNWITAFNAFALQHMGALWLTLAESIVRITYTLAISKLLTKLRIVRTIFELPET